MVGLQGNDLIFRAKDSVFEFCLDSTTSIWRSPYGRDDNLWITRQVILFLNEGPGLEPTKRRSNGPSG